MRGTRAGRKARDEFVQLRDFLFALRVFGFDARANGSFREDHVVVAAVVHDHGLVVDVGGVRADAIQKMAVVRDHDQHAFVFAQIILQPVDGIEVQVVRRLVEQQRGRIAEKRLRQQHANFLSALQFAHFALVQRFFHVEAVEQHRGIGFGRVAALFADDSFEFAEAHAVRVSELFVRLGVERVALLERFPQGAIAHDYGVDHAKFVEGELVLAQNAELFGTADGALGRLDFAGENLHQRGFARAIGAGNGVAPPGEESATLTSSNKILRAEAHRDVVNGEHSPIIIP